MYIFFCQNHGVVNAVAIGRRSLFLFQDHGLVNVVLKLKKICIFVMITYVVNVVAIVCNLKTFFLRNFTGVLHDLLPLQWDLMVSHLFRFIETNYIASDLNNIISPTQITVTTPTFSILHK